MSDLKNHEELADFWEKEAKRLARLVDIAERYLGYLVGDFVGTVPQCIAKLRAREDFLASPEYLADSATLDRLTAENARLMAALARHRDNIRHPGSSGHYPRCQAPRCTFGEMPGEEPCSAPAVTVGLCADHAEKVMDLGGDS